VLLASAFLRFYQLDVIPPGNAGDVAYNGLDIQQVLAGHLSVFFPANHGREALFIYFQALLVLFAGARPLVFAWSSAAMGLLTVATAYRFYRELFGWRVAVMAAALTSAVLGMLVMNRLGLRANSVAPLLFTTLYCLWRLLHTGRTRYGVFAGLALGLSLYTYIAARLIPILVVLLCLLEWRRARKHIAGLALLVGVSMLTFAPEGVYFLTHRADFSERAQEVSVFNPTPDFVGTPSTPPRSLLRTGQMFFIHGDDNPQHNLPGVPVFEPLAAIFFAAGLVLALIRSARGVRYLWPLLAMIAMSVPSALSHSSADFLQAMSALPLAAFFPALALEALAAAIPWQVAGWSLAGLVVVASMGHSAARFLAEWARNPQTPTLYGVADERLAAVVNAQPEMRAYVAFPFDDTLATFRLAAKPGLQTSWFPAEMAAVPLPREPRDTLYIGSASSVIRDLGPNVVPGLVPAGTTDTADGKTAYALYRLPAADQARFLQAQTPVNQTMGNDFRLVSYEAVSPPGRLVVNLVWQQLAPAGPYDLNIHLVNAAGQQAGQSDRTVWPLERFDGPTTHHWDATATLSSDDLLVTQHSFQAPPGDYTLEISAVHLGLKDPWTAGTPTSGPVGSVARLPAKINP